jgi:hypothetical protein
VYVCMCVCVCVPACTSVRVQLDILPQVGPEEVPRVYKCMHVFVAPYVRPETETFALANVEVCVGCYGLVLLPLV